MATYTELIFGAMLKPDTPQDVIETLKFLVDERPDNQPPDNFPFESASKARSVLMGGSYYFGVNTAVTKLYYCEISKAWVLSSRANCRNGDGRIGKFLNWIKPHIECGSGCANAYAIEIEEQESIPTVHFLSQWW